MQMYLWYGRFEGISFVSCFKGMVKFDENDLHIQQLAPVKRSNPQKRKVLFSNISVSSPILVSGRRWEKYVIIQSL